jgi:uncharacterized membrane protein YhhN
LTAGDRTGRPSEEGPRQGLRPWHVLAAGGLAIVAFVVGVARDMPLLRLVTKPLPVLGLAVLAASRRTRHSVTIAGGLVLGAVGDVLLEASPRLFVAGLVAFLAGHVAYVVAFLDGERRLHVVRALPPFAAGIAVLALLWPGLGPMRVPVTAYMLVICAMAWRAASRVERGRPDAWLALAGATLFLVSDSALGIARFLAPFPGRRAVILSTYWAAQLLVALSAYSSQQGPPAPAAASRTPEPGR